MSTSHAIHIHCEGCDAGHEERIRLPDEYLPTYDVVLTVEECPTCSDLEA